MLQDLDSLAARMGQLVQFTHDLQAERVALQARLKSIEQERNALRDQLERREAEHQSVAGRLDQHLSEIKAVREQAEVEQAELRIDLSRNQNEVESVKQHLLSCQADATRLRAVAGTAKERIDTILMRLPGAPQE